MANRTGKKGKKPLQTTLGKASYQNEKEVDLSHVRKPIQTSIFGLRQVLSLFQTATEEVQNYITYECDIIYECRTCRTIFRSLANFILHKRSYCRERVNPMSLLNNNDDMQENECSENKHTDILETKTVTPEYPERTSKEAKKSLSPIIEKLKENQQIRQLTQDMINEDLSLQAPTEDSNERKHFSNDLLLEEIATNNAAVFQTMLQHLPTREPIKSEFMKSEVMEIHDILDNDEAILGPDGKICTFHTNKVKKKPGIPKHNLICSECNLKFSTKKTLTYHIKYKHNNTRLVYVCPDCKDTFANAWCVYRHLYKIHRKTSAQIKRMREQIHNSCIRKDQEPEKKKEKKEIEESDKTDEENQWLNNIEGDKDFQMCGGCGKRFERKAALHSHAQMCVKRIAVCNNIKENNAKRKEDECKDTKIKVQKEKPEQFEAVKGASKRKPYLLRTYKTDENITIVDQEMPPTENLQSNHNFDSKLVNIICDGEGSSKVTEPVADVIRFLHNKEEEQSSPSKLQDCVSPSIDKIDTEKMLNIIGISSNYRNIHFNKETDSITETNETVSEKLTENKFHNASEFDLFCQNFVEKIEIAEPENVEQNTEKVARRIPLILRRRSSVKTNNRNPFLGFREKENPEKNEICELKTKDEIKKNAVEGSIHLSSNENELNEQKNEPSTSTSTFDVNVKSLEDLISVSSQNYNKDLQLTENEIPTDLINNQWEKNSSVPKFYK